MRREKPPIARIARGTIQGPRLGPFAPYTDATHRQTDGGTAINPRVSVIIPCYNTAKYVADALGSVFAQTWTDYEVVVINDGSPDTPELEAAIQPWRDRIVYLRGENRGLAAARNAGIEAARGELIALLDSDDYWAPDYLEIQVAKLEEDGTADIVYADAKIVRDGRHLGELFTDRSPSVGEVTFTSLIEEKCCPMVSVLARRSALERAGLFDASLQSCEDFDMWLRAVKTGSRIIYHDRAITFYRKRTGSLSSDPHWMYQHMLIVLRKMRNEVRLTWEERETVEHAIRRVESLRLVQEGKMALTTGDTARATSLFCESTAYVRNCRLSVILFFLRVVPRLVRLAYVLRSRLMGHGV